MIVQQAGQLSVDNQNVPTAGESHWHNAFVTLKSDFTELEKKCPEALMQLSHKVEVTKDCSTEKNQKQHPWYFRNDTVHLALKKIPLLLFMFKCEKIVVCVFSPSAFSNSTTLISPNTLRDIVFVFSAERHKTKCSMVEELAKGK